MKNNKTVVCKLNTGDDMTRANVEVWPSTDLGWLGNVRPNYLCAQDIGPIPPGEARSVICYTPLKVCSGLLIYYGRQI